MQKHLHIYRYIWNFSSHKFCDIVLTKYVMIYNSFFFWFEAFLIHLFSLRHVTILVCMVWYIYGRSMYIKIQRHNLHIVHKVMITTHKIHLHTILNGSPRPSSYLLMFWWYKSLCTTHYNILICKHYWEQNNLLFNTCTVWTL